MTDISVKLHSNRFLDREGKKHVARKKFNGILVTSTNYRELMDKGGRDLINYHNKHLRAYLKDEQFFIHGVGEDGHPKFHPVLKQYVIEPA